MVGAAAMAPWREFWPLPLTGPSQPWALHSDTMDRLPWERPLWACLVIYRYNAIPIGKAYNDIGILA